jgi:hypothetical protein
MAMPQCDTPFVTYLLGNKLLLVGWVGLGWVVTR